MALPLSVYSNLALFPEAPRATVVERKLAAVVSASAEADLKANVERVNRVLDAIEVRDKVLAGYISSLQKQKAANAKRGEKIEDAVLLYMEDNGLKTLAGVRCSMRLQPAAAALVVLDEKLIPREFMSTPKAPPAAPDKVAIKKALGADESLVPADWGVKLVSKLSLVRK